MKYLKHTSFVLYLVAAIFFFWSAVHNKNMYQKTIVDLHGKAKDFFLEAASYHMQLNAIADCAKSNRFKQFDLKNDTVDVVCLPDPLFIPHDEKIRIHDQWGTAGEVMRVN